MSSRSSGDRASLCTFTFSDNRRCGMPRHKRNSPFCFAHARQLRHIEEADETANMILEPVADNFISVAGLTQSLVQLYSAVAEGRIGPKQASALAKVSTVLLKSVQASNDEFRTAFIPSYWAQLVRDSYGELPDFRPRTSQPDPQDDSADTEEEETEEDDDSDDSEASPNDIESGTNSQS